MYPLIDIRSIKFEMCLDLSDDAQKNGSDSRDMRKIILE